jgi:hypothetical protein
MWDVWKSNFGFVKRDSWSLLSVKFINISPEHITKILHAKRCPNEENYGKID